MTIKIDGDLFQWEQNRYFSIDFDGEEPLFAQIFNYKTHSAPLIPIYNYMAPIPDFLLENPYPITILICTETHVLGRKEFRVLKRPKPKEYEQEWNNLIELNKLIGGDV